MVKSRRKARAIALQVLYELDCTRHELEITLAHHNEDLTLDAGVQDFARSLVLGVWPARSRLDRAIQKHAPQWPLRDMASIDRNILRIALWEVGMQQTTPVKVIINEAVELAKKYGSDSTAKFVNGVLGSLADNLTPLRAELAAPAPVA